MDQPAWVLGGIKTSKRGWGWKSLNAYTVWVLVFYWKIFFWGKITTVAFLFNKLTYKSPSYASTHCIHPSLLMSAWLTTIVVSVSALFCRKMSEKVNLSMETYQKKGKAFWQVLKQAKACGFNLGVFLPCKFFHSNKCFCFSNCISTQPCH